MAWKDDLQDASFRGVAFECVSIKDSTSKAQVVHQAPFSDEAIIEDMGKDPRKISITAVFTGDSYKSESDELIDALNERGTGTLVHPIYGICNASVLSHNVDHDADNVDACNISIEFVIGKEEQPFFNALAVPEFDIKKLILNSAYNLQTKLLRLKKLNPSAFFSLVSRIRNAINTARKYLNLAKKAIDNILSPPDFLVGLIDDISQLVTFDTSLSAPAKWRDLFKRINRFSKILDQDDDATLKQTWRAFTVSSHIAAAQSVIEQARTELSNNTESSFTPLELAQVRQSVRQVIQQAITEERATVTANNETDLTDIGNLQLIQVEQIQNYKNIADVLHLQIQDLIEQRPPLTTTTVLTPCTLHWLAHQLYGDYTRADEIQRLNPRLNNPALLLKGMELNVYAR